MYLFAGMLLLVFFFGLDNMSNVAKAECGGVADFVSIGGICYPDNSGLSEATVSNIVFNIFSWLMGLFTTLAIIAFVISGIQYVTAAGSEDQMNTAKDNAKYAIMGIIVGLSGFVIIQAINTALQGNSIDF